MRSLAVLTSVVLTGMWLGGSVAPVSAHDMFVNVELSDFAPQTFVHEDADPYKGWVDVTVKNTGTQPWGDFHFQITSPMGEDVSNVHFLVDPPYQPTSTQNPLTWVVDNVAVGATIDLYYYSDPVLPGETANFKVYTDNPDHVSFFGTCLYPTPVPEPVGLLLLGGAALLARRSVR